MEWYWIVLIIVGYLFIGGISAAMDDRLEGGIEEDFAAALVLFWPIILAAFLAFSIAFGIVKGCKWVANTINLLIDKIKSRRELRKAKKALRSQYENAEEPDSVIDDIDYVCPEKLRKRRVSSSFISIGK